MLVRKNIPIVFTTPGALMVKALAARARAGKPLDAEDEVVVVLVATVVLVTEVVKVP